MLPIYYGFTTNPRAFSKEMRRLKIEPALAFTETEARTHTLINEKSGETIVIVCLDLNKVKGKETTAIHALLVHEAVHVYESVLESMNCQSPRGEFEAYTLQYLSQCLFDEYKRRSK